METILKRLRRQKLLTDNAQLRAIVAETENGTIFDPASLRLYARKQCGAEPSFGWAKAMWKNLSDVKRNECTDVVTTSTALTHVPTDDMPQLPLPVAMMELTSAMQDLMYNATRLPIVSTPPTKMGKKRVVTFDRNDWFLTNASEMVRLTSEPRGVLESRLTVVCLHTYSGRKYVTWCQRRDTSVIIERVNRGSVILNDLASEAVRNGDMFVGITYIDEDVGQLLERDVMDNLYYMESHIGRLGTRHPRGLNAVHLNHLLHRSVRMFGGDWHALDTYGKWEKSEEMLTHRTGQLADTIREAIECRRTFTKSNVTDKEVRAAMRLKVGEKLGDVRRELNNVRTSFNYARTCRTEMKSAIVQSIAECTLQSRPVPPKLDTIRKDLAELPAFIGRVEDDAERVLQMTEPHAMHILGMSGVEELNRATIQAMWRDAQRMSHTDKTLGGRVSDDNKIANIISWARDFLLDLYSDEDDVASEGENPLQLAIDSITVDICV